MDENIKNAYFAGLIDGEGTVDLFSYKKGTLMRPVIKVDMTCEKTILALRAHFGGYVGKKKTDPANKHQWRWEVTFAKAIDVCNKIRPYLITKAEGADRLLAHKAKQVGRPKKNQPAS